MNKETIEARWKRLSSDFRASMQHHNWKAALQAAAQFSTLGPKYSYASMMMPFYVYMASNDTSHITLYGNQLLAGKYGKNPGAVLYICESIVDSRTYMHPRDLHLALRAAQRGMRLTNRSPRALNALAWTYHQMGNDESAMDLENEALFRLPPTDKSYRLSYEISLEEFAPHARG